MHSLPVCFKQEQDAKIMKLLVASSNDSLTSHPSNTSTDFTVELQRTLEAGECALGEISYSPSYIGELLVVCDICEESFIHEIRLPFLRTVSEPGEVKNLYFIPTSRPQFQRIRIRLLTKDLEIPPQPLGIVSCTLLFR